MQRAAEGWQQRSLHMWRLRLVHIAHGGTHEQATMRAAVAQPAVGFAVAMTHPVQPNRADEARATERAHLSDWRWP